jgi:hypothetical protein
MNFSVLQPASHPMRLIQRVGRFCHLSLRFPFFLAMLRRCSPPRTHSLESGQKHRRDCAVILLGCFRAKRVHIAMQRRIRRFRRIVSVAGYRAVAALLELAPPIPG